MAAKRMLQVETGASLRAVSMFDVTEAWCGPAQSAWIVQVKTRSGGNWIALQGTEAKARAEYGKIMEALGGVYEPGQKAKRGQAAKTEESEG